MVRTAMRLEAWLVVALGLLALAGCSVKEKDCVPGQAVSCACSDGRGGAQVCNDDGTYGECSCDTSPEPEGETTKTKTDTTDLDPFDGQGSGGAGGFCLAYPTAATYVSFGPTSPSNVYDTAVDLPCSVGDSLKNPFPVKARVSSVETRYSLSHCYDPNVGDPYPSGCYTEPRLDATHACNNYVFLQTTVAGVTYEAKLYHVSAVGVALHQDVDPFAPVASCGEVGWTCGDGTVGSAAHLHFAVKVNGAYQDPQTYLDAACQVLENPDGCEPSSTCCGADGRYVAPGQDGPNCSGECLSCNGGAGCVDSCTPTCPSGDGDYCGGPVGKDPTKLYRCTAGVYTEIDSCPPGVCHVSGVNQPDYCEDAPAGPTCNGPTAGLYCGDDQMTNAAADTLYYCSGPGATGQVREACGAGKCITASAGQDDYCQTASQDPTCNGPTAGLYCGDDQMTNAAADTLYYCSGPGATGQVREACGAGKCITASAGQDDYCQTASQDPTCNGPTAGLYCGDDNMSNAAADTLYYCSGPGATGQVREACGAGKCITASAGQDDYCQTASQDPTCNGPTAGLYCGDDNMSNAAADTLYYCSGPGATGQVREACGAGKCITASAGQDDYCQTASQDPTCSGPTAGLYCGDDNMSNAAADTLYYCSGPGAVGQVSQVCGAGRCVTASAGQDDYCQ